MHCVVCKVTFFLTDSHSELWRGLMGRVTKWKPSHCMRRVRLAGVSSQTVGEFIQYMIKPHLAHNIPMAVAGGQVQGCVISAVHDIDAGSTHNEHVHHIGASFTACPMKGTEAVVIPEGTEGNRAST